MLRAITIARKSREHAYACLIVLVGLTVFAPLIVEATSDVRLFLDANILSSAAYKDGSPAAILFEFSNAGRCQLLSSAFALEEARRNVTAKAGLRVAVLAQLTAQITIGMEPTRDELLMAANQGLPKKDAPILAAATATGAQALVTGDEKHFGDLFAKTSNGVLVCRLSEVIKLLTDWTCPGDSPSAWLTTSTSDSRRARVHGNSWTISIDPTI